MCAEVEAAQALAFGWRYPRRGDRVRVIRLLFDNGVQMRVIRIGEGNVICSGYGD